MGRPHRELDFPAVEIDGALVWTVQMDLGPDIMHAVEQFLVSHVAEGIQHVVLDVTAVPVIDSTLASSLEVVLDACRVAGATPYLCGIRPPVALTMVHLGITFPHATITRSVDHAMEQIRASQGPRTARASHKRVGDA